MMRLSVVNVRDYQLKLLCHHQLKYFEVISWKDFGFLDVIISWYNLGLLVEVIMKLSNKILGISV